MNVSFTTLFVLVIAAVAGVVFLHGDTLSLSSTPFSIGGTDVCEDRIAYSVGPVQTGANLTAGQARTIAQEAEAVWEDATEMDFLRYDEDAPFEIRISPDSERATALLRTLRRQYPTTLEDITAENISEKISTARASYRAEAGVTVNTDYPTLEELEQERVQLQQRHEKLQADQQEVNELVSHLNSLARTINEAAELYNQNVRTFSERYGISRNFDQGTYQDNTVTIYQFEQLADLRLALAHEFGHAIGIGHVDDSQAVMYYLMRDQQLDPITLRDADRQALDEACEDGCPTRSWHIGDVNERFGVSEPAVHDAVQTAVSVWEEAAGENLFEHSAGGDITVNLVFDERQEQTLARQRLESQLSVIEETHSELVDQYQSIRDEYEEKRADYRNTLAAYNSDKDAYDTRVAERNEAIERQQQQQQAAWQRIALNQLITYGNVATDTHFEHVYSRRHTTPQDRYGVIRPFPGLVAVDDGMAVYQFEESADLRLIIAHGFGHVFGLEHTEDPTGIMYSHASQQDIADLALSESDKTLISELCKK